MSACDCPNCGGAMLPTSGNGFMWYECSNWVCHLASPRGKNWTVALQNLSNLRGPSSIPTPTLALPEQIVAPAPETMNVRLQVAAMIFSDDIYKPASWAVKAADDLIKAERDTREVVK